MRRTLQSFSLNLAGRLGAFACALVMMAALAPAASAAAASQSDASAPTVLITGSNRGIGLGLARQYAKLGWNVIATARHPDAAEDLKNLAAEYPRISLETLDVTDQASIDVVAEKYRDTPIDVVINNAGILGKLEDQVLGSFNHETFEKVLAVNTIGPMRVAEAFLDHVRASDQKKIITVTSGFGSIALAKHVGGFYYYRISKAAVNMAMSIMQSDLRKEGVIVGLVSPGRVQTELMKSSGGSGTITPDESALGMIDIIEGLSLENSSAMINYDGEILPW